MKQQSAKLDRRKKGHCAGGHLLRIRPAPAELCRAAEIFRAMGDADRLRLVELLRKGEMCVSEIVAAIGDKFSTISQRLRILRDEGIVERRREKTHLYYRLADQHVLDLIDNALAHAAESRPNRTRQTSIKESTVSHEHPDHHHQHGPNCGHTAIRHGDHVDYLHDGHLHHQSGDKVFEHRLDVTATNPAACTPSHECGGHDRAHQHGPGCGHETVPHGDHVDYLVDGHLHHPHGEHCDDHGRIETT